MSIEQILEQALGASRVVRSGDLPKPATLAQARVWLECPTLALGDIVQLREEFATGYFKFPQAGERCIVTQVLDVPRNTENTSSAVGARRNDIALAFVDSDGDPLEFLHDSRMFQKVGSIYDPVTLPDGEQLQVN